MLKKENKEVDSSRVNDVLIVSKKVLNLVYVLLFILGSYAVIKLVKELNVIPFLKSVLKIVSPLFIGLLIAWLFDPIVTKLSQKGIKRSFGTVIVYAIFLFILFIILSSIIPMLSEQVNDFVSSLPSIFDTIKGWVEGVFDNLGHIENFDANAMKDEFFKEINVFAANLTQSLPAMVVDFVTALFSGIGNLLVGLIIGFYFLVSFDNVHAIMDFVPNRIQRDTKYLLDATNTSLRSFVKGALIDSTLVFIVSSLGFALVGLKAPILFGLFCGLTNVIPFAGPYIGGVPAVIVGLSQGIPTGLLTFVVIFVIQFIEGNFFQPLIMSKTTKLHPVTIMLGLLFFGHFFGIIGMLISTPIMAVLKLVFLFFEDKYNLLDFNARQQTEKE